MKRTKLFIGKLIVFILLMININNVSAQYFYYYNDNHQIQVDICDTLIAIRLDTMSVQTAEMISQGYDFLKDNFEFMPITGRFKTFSVNPGYNIEQVMTSLRQNEEIFMVNPVIIMRDTIPIYCDNSLIASFDEQVSFSQIESMALSLGLTINRTLDGEDSTVYLIEYRGKTDQNILDICNTLTEMPDCKVAEPDFFYNYNNLLTEPQDPYFNEQWHLHNICQTGGTEDCDIDFPEAWEYDTEDMTKCLAIIDAGFEMDHEDIPSGCLMWPYDAAGNLLIVDEEPIPDYDPSPGCDTTFARCWHGTMMLGLVAPVINNDVGLSGITDFNKIFPIKYCDNFGNWNKSTFFDALHWASTGPHSANVICCPWYMIDTSAEVTNQLERMYNNGQAVFFAAGNSSIVEYPANLPFVCAVGMTDYNDNVPSNSGQGPTLDLVAPGKNVWSFDLSGDAGINPAFNSCNGDPNYYCYFSGSSAAVGVAAAVATRILSTRPSLIGKTDNAQPLFDVMTQNAVDIGPSGFDFESGWGRLSAYESIRCHGICGDANGDTAVNVSDAVWIINYVFVGGNPPMPALGCGDVNDDMDVNVSDAIAIINYAFIGGFAPYDCALGYWYSEGGDCCPFTY